MGDCSDDYGNLYRRLLCSLWAHKRARVRSETENLPSSPRLSAIPRLYRSNPVFRGTTSAAIDLLATDASLRSKTSSPSVDSPLLTCLQCGPIK
jgi:hypothetical protein